MVNMKVKVFYLENIYERGSLEREINQWISEAKPSRIYHTDLSSARVGPSDDAWAAALVLVWYEP
jgi:hypothetical protein